LVAPVIAFRVPQALEGVPEVENSTVSPAAGAPLAITTTLTFEKGAVPPAATKTVFCENDTNTGACVWVTDADPLALAFASMATTVQNPIRAEDV
jgi:hypothetical protein